VGLDSKGIVRPGMDADIVRFDPAVVEAQSTYNRPRRYPKGISDVMVNGEFIVRDGETRDTLSGEVLEAGTLSED